MYVQFSRVSHTEFFKTFQHLEDRFTSKSCVKAGTTSNHAQVLSEFEGSHSLKVRLEGYLSLLPDLVIKEVFMWFRRYLKNWNWIEYLDQTSCIFAF
jgi:hypothetical protein